MGMEGEEEKEKEMLVHCPKKKKKKFQKSVMKNENISVHSS